MNHFGHNSAESRFHGTDPDTLARESEPEPDICPCCGEDMAPGQEFCCSDDFPEPGDIRETGR